MHGAELIRMSNQFGETTLSDVHAWPIPQAFALYATGLSNSRIAFNSVAYRAAGGPCRLSAKDWRFKTAPECPKCRKQVSDDSGNPDALTPIRRPALAD
jgi:hypothetical protein